MNNLTRKETNLQIQGSYAVWCDLSHTSLVVPPCDQILVTTDRRSFLMKYLKKQATNVTGRNAMRCHAVCNSIYKYIYKYIYI